MISLMLSDIAQAIGGELIGTDVKVDQVFIDSRIDNSQIVRKKALFVALKGPHFDAHNFVEQVADDGVAGFVVEKRFELNIPQILVKNTRIALAEIARLNRQKSSAEFIAITGSSGKTTVKEMIASILSLSGPTFATKGNLNNDIGVPLTLLDIDEKVQFGVVELGANHAGEVAFTADIVQPNIALVNNVSAAHLQGFGDVQGVARAKAEIYSSLGPNGVAIVNADDEYSSFFDSKIEGQKLSFSVESTADVFASEIEMNEDQSTRFTLNYLQQQMTVELPLVGQHNVLNALAAASCCIANGIPLKQIAQGLAKTPKVAGRLIVKNLDNGCRIIDDSYNANVASMKAAIDLLKNYSAPKILVLGDMAELGEFGRQCHEQIGEYAANTGIDILYSCGVLTQFSQLAFARTQAGIENNAPKSESNGNHFTSQKELIIKLKNEANAGATLLIKGSRSAHMENIVNALIECTSIDYSDNNHSNPTEQSAASHKGDQ